MARTKKTARMMSTLSDVARRQDETTVMEQQPAAAAAAATATAAAGGILSNKNGSYDRLICLCLLVDCIASYRHDSVFLVFILRVRTNLRNHDCRS
jgi:hypothetical protein